jgi:hypothetical protein
MGEREKFVMIRESDQPSPEGLRLEALLNVMGRHCHRLTGDGDHCVLPPGHIGDCSGKVPEEERHHA